MSKLNLSNVTLVCVDSVHTEQARLLLKSLADKIYFYDVKLFYENINSIEDYNLFIANKLFHEVDSEYCMIVQLDGYPINLSAWDPRFLDYDYIGAPWYLHPWPIDKTVGNGGFSIRSKAFLEKCMTIEYDGEIPEDIFFCRWADDILKESGIKFAPHDLAYMFSVENLPYKGQFGFHGKNTIELNKALGVFTDFR